MKDIFHDAALPYVGECEEHKAKFLNDAEWRKHLIEYHRPELGPAPYRSVR